MRSNRTWQTFSLSGRIRTWLFLLIRQTPWFGQLRAWFQTVWEVHTSYNLPLRNNLAISHLFCGFDLTQFSINIVKLLLASHVSYLFIFGNSRVVKRRDPVYQAVWANNTDFDEVLISPVMIQDHMPDKVLEALNKVCILLSWILNLRLTIFRCIW